MSEKKGENKKNEKTDKERRAEEETEKTLAAIQNEVLEKEKGKNP